MKRHNISLIGGPCTGKSTLAAYLFGHLKKAGYDYDLIASENRKIKKEIGNFLSPFELFYAWHIQYQVEENSKAKNGYITDQPLFNFYNTARLYQKEGRDSVATAELLKMSLEIKDRYEVIIIARNPMEISYKNDEYREIDKNRALKKHHLHIDFAERYLSEKIVYVEGSPEERLKQVMRKFKKLTN